jgi:mRNA deadenylase 3'-5' endonuclease subunit Ccr4
MACEREHAPETGKRKSRNDVASTLRFVSWNVLGDTNLRNNAYLYRHCDPQALHSRVPRILDGIVKLNADVVALQEVENFDCDYKAPLAQFGMDGLWKQRTGADQVDGVALIWRQRRLKLVHVETIEYASALTASAANREQAEQLRKHNVGLVAAFTDLSNGRELVVATTHILWNPKRGQVKLRQMQHLLRRVDAVRRPAPSGGSVTGVEAVGLEEADGPAPRSEAVGGQPPPTRAVVALGDWNAAPGSVLHAFLLGRAVVEPLKTERTWDGQEAVHRWMHSAGHQDPRQPLPPPPRAQQLPQTQPRQQGGDGQWLPGETHPLAGELVSAYGHVGEPECTSFHHGFKGTVDYILLTAADLQVRTVLPLPNLREMSARRSLPDFLTPSDHLPIACDLSWR